ncbi:hypothetical protein GOV08_03605 [Candidatus Woesearchaeota archaeon]|nr:hypothetical protein [Candidatus Woesearchaeota archaeon]
MIDIRKILIIFVIATLFSILVFSTIDAIYPRPDFNDFCEISPRAVPLEKADITNITQETCEADGGKWERNWCNYNYYCEKEWENARKNHNFIVFIISALMGVAAILAGMYLPAKPDTINEWVGTGFMLGGLFALFFGTAQSYSDLHRIIRPIVIFIELALVIFISYKKLGKK